MAEVHRPRFPKIFFGTGHEAGLIAEKPEERDDLGIKVKPMLILPLEDLKQTYKIKTEDLIYKEQALWKEYPTKQMVWLNNDPKNSVLLIMCGFNREKTVVTEMMQGFIEADEQRDKFEETLLFSNAQLQEHLRDALDIRADTHKYIEQAFRQLFKPQFKESEGEESEEGEES